MVKRREPGEGNVYQRKDGRWAGRVTTGYEDGKQHRKWVYGRTRADAMEKLRPVRTMVH